MNTVSRNFFLKQATFSAAHQAYKDCPYYPCHELPSGQDHLNCLFCYCPFYPCGNRVGDGQWIKSGKKKTWDCTPCSFIHRDGVSARLFGLMFEGRSRPQMEKIIRREYHPAKRKKP